jgi:hypothetical protein
MWKTLWGFGGLPVDEVCKSHPDAVENARIGCGEVAWRSGKPALRSGKMARGGGKRCGNPVGNRPRAVDDLWTKKPGTLLRVALSMHP